MGRKRTINLKGKRFGKIVILDDGKRVSFGGSSGYTDTVYKCRCDCGKVFTRRQNHIQASKARNNNQSCGCARHSARRKRFDQRCIEAGAQPCPDDKRGDELTVRTWLERLGVDQKPLRYRHFERAHFDWLFLDAFLTLRKALLSYDPATGWRYKRAA